MNEVVVDPRQVNDFRVWRRPCWNGPVSRFHTFESGTMLVFRAWLHWASGGKGTYPEVTCNNAAYPPRNQAFDGVRVPRGGWTERATRGLDPKCRKLGPDWLGPYVRLRASRLHISAAIFRQNPRMGMFVLKPSRGELSGFQDILRDAPSRILISASLALYVTSL